MLCGSIIDSSDALMLWWFIISDIECKIPGFVLLQKKKICLNMLINIGSSIQVENLQDLYWNIYQKFCWPWIRNTVTISVAGYSKLSIKMGSLLPELPESRRSSLLRWCLSKFIKAGFDSLTAEVFVTSCSMWI